MFILESAYFIYTEKETLKYTKKAHVNKVCRDILCCPLNFSVQVEELKLLVSLNVKFDCHHVVIYYVHLTVKQRKCQNQVSDFKSPFVFFKKSSEYKRTDQC